MVVEPNVEIMGAGEFHYTLEVTIEIGPNSIFIWD